MKEITERIESEVAMITSRLEQNEEGQKAEGENLRRQLTIVEEGVGTFKADVGSFQEAMQQDMGTFKGEVVTFKDEYGSFK